MELNNIVQEERENTLAGVVGALLFSLAGGVLWFLLYQVGFLAGISGLVAVICAIKGYALFAKKESLKGVILSVICAVFTMVLAWYLCLSTDVYKAYQDGYAAGEVDFTLTFSESVRNAYIFLEEPEIATPYLKDLGIGLLLCAFGAYRSVSDATKRIKAEKEAAQAANPAEELQ